MEINTLNAIAPCDGRYYDKTKELALFFSESALIRYRIMVEVEYFIALCELPLPELKKFDKKKFDHLRSLYQNFTLTDAQRIKEIEKTTNHDVKAVEYLLKEKFDLLQISQYKEFIHFGLTSQDINNTAQPMMLADAHSEVMVAMLENILQLLRDKAIAWKNIPMLAHTHGQPASPTRLGKEIYVFVERLVNQVEYFNEIPNSAKFGGATGNFNAHYVAYPDIDWVEFGNLFLDEYLDLHPDQATTQIEHYDNLAAYFDNWCRINTIFIDLCRDIWTYVSMEYFKQKIKAGEVGSSAMPHKVNPIDFENAEGNFGIANALFKHLSGKLPISRLQRDLTDSTVMRTIGIPMAHTLIALKSLEKGIQKLIVNEEKMAADLDNNWAVIAEAIQTILRKEGYPEPYETLKALTRTNSKVTQQSMAAFIDELNISDALKKRLKSITPFNYLGVDFDFD
ncbi:MAG: adenylosuccinate lyase [Bacteroidales bacterium]|nr:adenylosuccinate lyase [Bacteroidales bacterium]